MNTNDCTFISIAILTDLMRFKCAFLLFMDADLAIGHVKSNVLHCWAHMLKQRIWKTSIMQCIIACFCNYSFYWQHTVVWLQESDLLIEGFNFSLETTESLLWEALKPNVVFELSVVLQCDCAFIAWGASRSKEHHS